MGVFDGQAVSAAVTNPAFLDANADDVALGKIGFHNSDVISGGFIDNIQRATNSLFDTTGATETTPGTAYGATANTINDGDSHETALTDLANKFDPSTGHNHDGTAGQGPPITGAAVGGVPLFGAFQKTNTITASGTSDDVSTEFAGKTPSTNSTTRGVVVNTPFNRVFIRQATGSDAGNPVTDTGGEEVYGRLTESASVWTLTYFTLISGVETSYNFTSSTDIIVYYQELFRTLVDYPVYDYLASIFANKFSSSSGSGGGGSLQWIEDTDSPTPEVEFNNQVYLYEAALDQSLYALVKVPSSYVAGNPINLLSFFYSPDTTGNVLIQTEATLIRAGVDAMSTTTNQHTSSNTAVTLSGGTVNEPQPLTLDLSDGSGQINGVAVGAGDLIKVRLFRGTDTSTEDARVPVYGSETTFTP